MTKTYRSAMGKHIDVDRLRLNNENVIAVGNMRVNARGDELGQGGKIIRTRDQIMKEYYALNTPVAADMAKPKQAEEGKPKIKEDLEPVFIRPESGMDEIDTDPVTIPIINAPLPPMAKPPVAKPALSTPAGASPQIRGSLASSVAKGATITQKELLPPSKARGVQRF